MPISFLFAGVFLIISIFGFLPKFKKVDNFIFVLLAVIYLISFFASSVSIGDMDFNILQMFTLLVLILLFFARTKKKFMCCISLLLAFVFSYLFDSNLMYWFLDNSEVFVLLMLLPVLTIKNIFDYLFVSLGVLTIFMIRFVILEINEYTIAGLDSSFVFDGLVVALMLFAIREIISVYSKNILRRMYEKKNYTCFDTCNVYDNIKSNSY